MGVWWSHKIFEVSQKTKDRMKDEHYFIDMEEGLILFDEDINEYIAGLESSEDGLESSEDDAHLSFEEKLNEWSIVDIDCADEYGYGIQDISFYKTKSGDIVCIVDYAY